MEFIWNVEEQKISRMTTLLIEDLADSMTLEEQLEAIDKYGQFDFNVREQLALREKFLSDVKYGIVKETKKYLEYPSWHYNRFATSTIKSWLKKHGVHVYDYEDYDSMMRLEGYSHWNKWASYCELDADDKSVKRYVRDLFCRMLYDDLTKLEAKWFAENDEYTIEQNKFNKREKYYGFIKLPVHTSHWSSGQVDIHIGDGDGVKATLKQLKALNKFYDNLDKEVEEFFTEKFKNYPIKP